MRSSPALSLHVRRYAPAIAAAPEPDESVEFKAEMVPIRVRFGFTVSKKVAKRAHDRNHIKRRLSEIARTVVIPSYTGVAGFDCVVVVRRPAMEFDFTVLRAEFLSLLACAGIVSPQQLQKAGFCQD